MSSAFAAAWTRASADIDARFGEPFEYQPMAESPAGGRPIADPTRPIVVIIGALTEKPTFVYPDTRSRRSSIVAQEATQEMLIDIANTALPYTPQSGDRLQQVTVDASGIVLTRGAIFQVNGPQPDGIARTELRVFKRLSGPAS